MLCFVYMCMCDVFCMLCCVVRDVGVRYVVFCVCVMCYVCCVVLCVMWVYVMLCFVYV